MLVWESQNKIQNQNLGWNGDLELLSEVDNYFTSEASCIYKYLHVFPDKKTMRHI